MKKTLMILGNVLIVAIILVLVTVYVETEQKRILASQTESFENTRILNSFQATTRRCNSGMHSYGWNRNPTSLCLRFGNSKWL